MSQAATGAIKNVAGCVLLLLGSHGCKHREDNSTGASSAKVQPEFSVNVACGQSSTSFLIKVAGKLAVDQMSIGASCYSLAPILKIECRAGDGSFYLLYSTPDGNGGTNGPYKDRDLCQSIRNSLFLKFKTAAASAPATP